MCNRSKCVKVIEFAKMAPSSYVYFEVSTHPLSMFQKTFHNCVSPKSWAALLRFYLLSWTLCYFNILNWSFPYTSYTTPNICVALPCFIIQLRRWALLIEMLSGLIPVLSFVMNLIHYGPPFVNLMWQNTRCSLFNDLNRVLYFMKYGNGLHFCNLISVYAST